MKAATKARCVAIADEIRTEAFVASKAKSPREHFNRIHTLAKEACDYFAFGLEAKPAPEPVEVEPVEFGFTCGVPDCAHDDSETETVGYATMREALDASKEHRLTHSDKPAGIVTYERAVAS